jgi:sodium transport system permease protein
MRVTWIVFIKEFLENLRDRRTVLTALLLGPLFGPILFGAMLQFSLERGRSSVDETVTLGVLNSEAAPNLIGFLQSRGIDVNDLTGGEATARKQIASHTLTVVLQVSEDYAARLGQGLPAPLRLYADSSRNGDQRYVARVRSLLAEYGQRMATSRLALRGVDPLLLSPIAIQDVDVSTPAGRALLMLGMMSFFLILSLLTGGMYLAIDTTVGERERGTLEPLLATPVSRESLLYGKLLATCAYMLLSLIITTTALFVVLGRIDLEQFGMSANLGAGTALKVIGVTAPLIPLLASLMTLVAAFTRSAREAQAWLGVLQLVPTLPLVFASLLNLGANLPLMTVPSLSQHLLITQLLRAEQLSLVAVLISVGVTLGLGAIVVSAVANLYRRESLLG